MFTQQSEHLTCIWSKQMTIDNIFEQTLCKTFMSQVRIQKILGDNFQRFFTRIFGSHLWKASVVEHQLIPLIDPRLTCRSLLYWHWNQYLIKILIDNRLTSQLLLSQNLLNISVSSQSSANQYIWVSQHSANKWLTVSQVSVKVLL